MKKNENLDSQLQILTPNQEIFKNSRIFSFFIICLSFFFKAVSAATGEVGLRAFLGKSLHVGKAGSGGAALLNFP